MVKIKVIRIMIIILILQSIILSNENKTDKKYTIGFGTNFTYNHYYLPINIKSKIRIEPEIDIALDFENYEQGTESSYIKTGLGLFRKSQINNCLIYYGSRLKYSYIDYTSKSGNNTYESIRNYLCFTPSIGGEYYLINRVSLGVELQLQYVHTFNDIHNYNGTNLNYETDGLESIALFFMRFYLI